jgi:hypothetical protein
MEHDSEIFQSRVPRISEICFTELRGAPGRDREERLERAYARPFIAFKLALTSFSTRGNGISSSKAKRTIAFVLAYPASSSACS